MSAAMVHVSHAYNKYGHGQGTHQSDLGADGNVLVVPDDFQFGHCSRGLAILESTSGLDPSSDTIAPRYVKLRAVSSSLDKL